jgi:hypothetical protein
VWGTPVLSNRFEDFTEKLATNLASGGLTTIWPHFVHASNRTPNYFYIIQQTNAP